MADRLRIGGKWYDNIEYITILNESNENVRYYKGGQGGVNFRVATSEEIEAILNGSENFQQSNLNTVKYRAANTNEINNILKGGEING